MKFNKEIRPYIVFEQYCLRTPLFSLDFYKQLHEKSEISDAVFKKMFADKVIQEAIYTASADLFDQIQKWMKGQIIEPKDICRLRFSFLKYLNRMSTRSTPFGLFASCALGKFSNETAVVLGPLKNYQKDSRLDMTFTSMLLQKLGNDPGLKSALLYYPNSSLYKILGEYRYVEYLMKENKREHLLQSVTSSSYLEKILEAARKGRSIQSLSTILVDEGFPRNDSVDFIEGLISNQMLVSNIEPTVTGISILDQLNNGHFRSLKKNELFQGVKRNIQELTDTQQIIGLSAEKHQILQKSFNKLGLLVASNNLVQTDFYTNVHKNKLNRELMPVIEEILSVLNKITAPQINYSLNNFKETFVKRYGQKEVELVKVLDPEMGIGYGKQKNDAHPFLEDIHLPGPKKDFQRIRWTSFDDILLPLVNEALRNNQKTIVLKKENLSTLKENWNDLPETFSAIVEIYKNKNQERVYLNSAGGSSAANLLARFCLGNDGIKHHVENIIDIEEQMNPDKIYAEIVHLPQVRTGNILRRPAFRKYEIPYLAQSSLCRESQIPVNDLLLCIQADKLILRSRRLKKEIMPRLTNAHNYTLNPLPLYHFLCDLQTQDLREAIGFQWNSIFEKFDFLPRVEYKNHILSKARWYISNQTIKEFCQSEKKERLEKVSTWRKELELPQYVYFVEGDNKLLIDFENFSSIDMFLKSAKKIKRAMLEEFLFDDEGTVKKGEEKFCNEFVVSFHKQTIHK